MAGVVTPAMGAWMMGVDSPRRSASGVRTWTDMMRSFNGYGKNIDLDAARRTSS
jgi:hypothetical protein